VAHKPQAEPTHDIVDISVVKRKVFPVRNPGNLILEGRHDNMLPPEDKIEKGVLKVVGLCTTCICH